MPMHQSVSTIQNPEFINLQPLDISPLMSSCEIKVFYLGQNRNHSFITKEVATEMAKSLRGAPIVGAYSEKKEDFGDHGHQVIIDNDGIQFNCLTKPYGFVSPDAKVWFQTFTDTDEFGNEIEREYLMTTGYLWTEQFPECKPVVQEGRPHSMELDEDTLDGHWAIDNNSGIDFFIINDALISKLCILGNDVEPCFEGSSVTKPEVSANFTKMDNEFKNTLFSMMQDLQFALKGGQEKMPESENIIQNDLNEQANETPVVEEPVVENSLSEDASTVEEKPVVENFEKDNKDDDNDDKDDNKDKDDDTNDNDDDDKDDEKEKYSLLKSEYDELSTKFSKLEKDFNELLKFKENVDNEKKDELINSFYMLSDEDKKEVIENKANYSLDEIEAKLSVICVRNKVNFDLDDNSENQNIVENEKVTTFNLNDATESVPAWIKAIQRVSENKYN